MCKDELNLPPFLSTESIAGSLGIGVGKFQLSCVIVLPLHLLPSRRFMSAV